MGLVFLLAAEGVLQVARQILPGPFEINKAGGGIVMAGNPRLLFGMTPGNNNQGGMSVRTNSLGWRGPEIHREKPPGTYRIIFLGDSSVWGDGVEEQEAFPFLTATLLRVKEGRAVEALNASTPGYSSTQSRIVFEDSMDEFHPDAVVIASIWSDIIVRPWQDRDLLRKFSTEGFRFDSKARLAMRKSALLSLLEVQIESLKGIPEDRQIIMSSIINRDVHPWSTGRPRVSVEEHAENLRAMCREARERRMDICLLILQCDPKIFNWPKDRLNAYRDNFRRTAREFDAMLLDVPSILPSDAAELSRLFLDGIHPNARAHRIIAEALAGAFASKHGSAR